MSVGLLKASAKISAILAEESEENVRVIVRSLCATLGLRIMTPEEEAFANSARTKRERDSERMRTARERKREQSEHCSATCSAMPPSPSRALSSPSPDSISISEQNLRDQDPASTGRAREASAPVTPVLDGGPAPPNAAAMITAFEEGMSAGQGGSPWGLPVKQRPDLYEAVRVHGRAYVGEELRAWLRFEATNFVRAVRAMPPDRRKYFPLTAHAFGKWLSETPAAEQPSGVLEVAPAVAKLAAGIGGRT